MKKRGSRWLAFLLAVVLSVTMIPICTVSAKDFENASASENEASEYKPEAEQTDELVELQSDDREAGNLILYSGHLQSYGDMASVADGAVLGTTGQAKRLEAIRISKGENIADVDGSIMYRVHVQSYGTQDWVADGALAGTTGQAKRIEAIQIRLTGDLSEQYDIYYAVHVQKYGWTKWTRGLAEGDSTDGSAGWCGTNGLSLRVEAIRIVLVEKNGTVPTNDGSWSYLTGSDMGSIVYSGHQQTYGNLTAVSNGTTLGTTGAAKRMEAVSISLSGGTVSGSVQYRVHVQKEGWQNWVSDGSLAGTTGLSRRLEAIEIRLSGDIANYCDVWYRVHVEQYGWLGWAKNGQTAGTTGISYRIEAIEIRLVPKAGTAPGANSGYYKDTPKITAGRVIQNGNIYYYNSNGVLYRTVYGNQKMVALTYDDGPSQYTSIILDTLEKYGGKATFFVVGERVGAYSSIVKREYSLGCQIGNHTYNHTILTSVSTAVIQNQINATNTAVKNVTGVSPTVMRPPGGSYNSTVKSTVGMPIILWSIDTLDWKTRNSASTVSSVLNHVQDGDIVLMHDLYSATATASLTIIPGLISRGYQLVTVEEMALLRGGMSNGVVYSAFR